MEGQSRNIPVKLFVGRVPNAMNEDELRPILEEFGQVLEINIIRDKATGLHKGCAFVKFNSLSEADNAIQTLNNQRRLNGATGAMIVKYADGEEARIGLPAPGSSAAVEQKLFVGALPKTTTEDELQNLFSQFGRVENVFIMKDPQGMSKGCAFIKMTNKEESILAIQNLNNKGRVNDSQRPLEVRWAEKKGANPAVGGAPVAAAGNFGGAPPAAPRAFGALPAPWAEYFTPEGRPYYYNNVTGVTQWDRPMDTPAAPGFPPAGPVGAAGAANYPQGPAGANLFIFHLPNDWSEQDLASHFRGFGNVLSARIMKDMATGRSKGFGFVSFDNSASAAAAIAGMNGYAAGSKRLKVSLKKGDDGNPAGVVQHMGSQNRFQPY